MRNESNQQEFSEIEVLCEDIGNKEIYSFRNIRVRKKESLTYQQLVMENEDLTRFLQNASVFAKRKEIILAGDGNQEHYQLLFAVLMNDQNDGWDMNNSQQMNIEFITLEGSENICSDNNIIKLYFWRLRKPMPSQELLGYLLSKKQQYQAAIKQEENAPFGQNTSMYLDQLQQQQDQLIYFVFEDLELSNLSDLQFHMSFPIPSFLISDMSNRIANCSQQLIDLREIILYYPILCCFIEDAVIFQRQTNQLGNVERILLGMVRFEDNNITSNQNLNISWDGISPLRISFLRLEKQHPRFSVPMVISQFFNSMKQEDNNQECLQLNQQQQAHLEAIPKIDKSLLETSPLFLQEQTKEKFQVKSEEVLTSQNIKIKLEQTLDPLSSLPHYEATSNDKTINNQNNSTVDNFNQSEIPIQKRKPQAILKTRGGRGSEKQIGWALQRVLEWRYLNHNKNISLAAAANELGLTKQSLDNYFLELRIGELFGFELFKNLDNKFGILRQFNKKAIEIYHNTTNKAKIPILSELKFSLEEFNQWRLNQKKNNKDIQNDVKQEDEEIEDDLEEEICQKSMECSKTLLPKMETTQLYEPYNNWPYETECTTHTPGLILRQDQKQQKL